MSANAVTTTPFESLPKERLLEMLKQMWEVRVFEESVEMLFAQGKIYGTTHLCVGMEASSVGSVNTLRPDDYITSTHRGHGHIIAKGADLGKMMAELMGRETGYCKGKGGSMHIADLDLGNLGANGIVGGGLPIATGAGLALKLQNRPQVVLCFFGDGASNEGSFHEAVNLAAVWKLPVVFICENNQYGMSGSVKRMAGNPNIHERSVSYGIPGYMADGNDIGAVYDLVAQAVEHARSGEGPVLLELKTYRWKGHSKSDANRYRTREEIEEWRGRCPIKRFKQYLTDKFGVSADELDAIEKLARQNVDEAIKFAEASPPPELSELMTDIYSE